MSGHYPVITRQRSVTVLVLLPWCRLSASKHATIEQASLLSKNSTPNLKGSVKATSAARWRRFWIVIRGSRFSAMTHDKHTETTACWSSTVRTASFEPILCAGRLQIGQCLSGLFSMVWPIPWLGL
jgi:hypothetical protein